MNNADAFPLPQTSTESATPAYLRLPKPGRRCSLTGLSRTALYELCSPCQRNDFRPPVRSVLLRRKGAARGIRLIPLKPLLEYLAAQGSDSIAQSPRNGGLSDA